MTTSEREDHEKKIKRLYEKLTVAWEERGALKCKLEMLTAKKNG